MTFFNSNVSFQELVYYAYFNKDVLMTYMLILDRFKTRVRVV